MLNDKNSLIIVMPTYNELENLKLLIPKIKLEFEKHKISGGLLIVDDNSPDGTREYLYNLKQKIESKHFYLKTLYRKGKLGLGTAYIAGYDEALKSNPNYILGMDADFSHNPKYIAEIFKNLQTYKMVIGSRYVTGGAIRNWNIWRKIVSRIASLYAKTVLGWSINDPTTAFVGFNSESLKFLPYREINTGGYGFLIELKYMAFKAKFSIKEIPIIFEDRIIGSSKLNKKIILATVFNTLLLRLRKYNSNEKS